MSTRYLIHFAHEHLTFRLAELSALASKNLCRYKWLTEPGYLEKWPYLCLELDDDCGEESLIDTTRQSFLVKGLYELWGSSTNSIDELADSIKKSPNYPMWHKQYSPSTESFRVDVECFNAKRSQDMKVEWIQKMEFLDDFDCRPNLKNPKHKYCIFQINDKNDETQTAIPKVFYFGRLINDGSRASLTKFNLRERMFIANTTMDPLLSFIAANTAKIENSDFVFDPFVGSGSLLIAAAHSGAYVFGADIDWALLHGKSRPSRKGQKVRETDESVRANFKQYGLENRYVDVMVSDITLSPLLPSSQFDAIISDPPYGIREGSERIGSKKTPKPLKEGQVKYPSKVNYELKDLYRDLLQLAARHLTIRGRLVYFLPIPRNSGLPYESFIPNHPSLELVTYCAQDLTFKTSRLMVIMEKHKQPGETEKTEVSDVLDGTKLRDLYFSKTNQ